MQSRAQKIRGRRLRLEFEQRESAHVFGVVLVEEGRRITALILISIPIKLAAYLFRLASPASSPPLHSTQVLSTQVLIPPSFLHSFIHPKKKKNTHYHS
jgi:hypothetical protein